MNAPILAALLSETLLTIVCEKVPAASLLMRSSTAIVIKVAEPLCWTNPHGVVGAVHVQLAPSPPAPAMYTSLAVPVVIEPVVTDVDAAEPFPVVAVYEAGSVA